jgi:hypothetical protein
MPMFKKKKLEPIGEGLLPCLVGEQILAQSTINPLIIELKNLVSVPLPLYDDLYLTTLKRVAELCQAMPWDKKSKPYTLLAEQIRLCCAVLKQRQGLMLPQGSSAERIAEQEPLWTFAFFAGALLFHLSGIQHDRSIVLSNVDGNDKTAWHPVWGTLYQKEKFYSITWQPYYVLPSNSLGGALIKYLLPQTAFHWLTGSPDIFSIWWQATTNAKDNSNVITQLINDVAQKINYISRKPSDQNQSTKITVSQTITAPVETENNPDSVSPHESLGMLLQWLQPIANEVGSSAEKNIPTDLPTIFKVEQGLFVANTVLSEFIDEKSEWENYLELTDRVKSFLIEENENRFFRYRSVEFDDRRSVEGVVIANDYLSENLKSLSPNNQLISFETH